MERAAERHIAWLHQCLREAGHCIDGGKCHHSCGEAQPCSRMWSGCVPLSGSWLTDEWILPTAPDLDAAALRDVASEIEICRQNGGVIVRKPDGSHWCVPAPAATPEQPARDWKAERQVLETKSVQFRFQQRSTNQ